jgi:hypothetical protein
MLMDGCRSIEEEKHNAAALQEQVAGISEQVKAKQV